VTLGPVDPQLDAGSARGAGNARIDQLETEPGDLVAEPEGERIEQQDHLGIKKNVGGHPTSEQLDQLRVPNRLTKLSGVLQGVNTPGQLGLLSTVTVRSTMARLPTRSSATARSVWGPLLACRRPEKLYGAEQLPKTTPSIRG
jgi:hypothetical protein